MAYTTIDKPTDYFNTTLYSGNNGTQSITSLDFQPDFLWFKSRNTVVSNTLVDSIRGNTKQLFSDSTGAEITPTYPYVDTFNSDGWTMINGALSGGNTSGRTYVNWSWKANGAGVSNTDGSITSTVSANTTSGFSIVSYTGTASAETIGHGLGAIPKIVIIKNRDRVSGWHVGGGAIGSVNQYLNLNDTAAIDSAGTGFQSFSSTTFGIGTDTDWNASGESIIAYCFAEKKGYSKFGSYTGNGSTDGTFVYTGFKPAFVMIKISSGSDSWVVYDNKRDTFNVTEQILRPNTSGAENTEAGAKMDLLSNGFKLRGSGGGIGQTNTSGETYIYMAFAENPFVTSTGIPTTAR
jgi:hypothetical protein